MYLNTEKRLPERLVWFPFRLIWILEMFLLNLQIAAFLTLSLIFSIIYLLFCSKRWTPVLNWKGFKMY